jgi:hypothetical protein
MLWHSELRVPVATGLDVGLEFGIAVDVGVVVLLVWIEGGGVRGNVDCVGAMEVGSTQGYGRRVSYSDV